MTTDTKSLIEEARVLDGRKIDYFNAGYVVGLVNRLADDLEQEHEELKRAHEALRSFYGRLGDAGVDFHREYPEHIRALDEMDGRSLGSRLAAPLAAAKEPA